MRLAQGDTVYVCMYVCMNVCMHVCLYMYGDDILFRQIIGTKGGTN